MEFLSDLWASLFDGDKPTPRNVRRLTKAVSEPHGDQAPRINAAHTLARWGTPDAVRGLIRRFAIQTPSGAKDTEEKQEVRDLLIEIGRPAVEPLLQYLEGGEEAAYAAQALEAILPEEELVEAVTRSLERLEGTYTRTPKGKVALIDVLSRREDPRIPPAVLPFLEDPNDDITFAAIDCLARPAYQESARPALLELCLESDGRPRIQSHILDRLIELGWPLTGYRRKLEERLPEGYRISKDGKLSATGA